MTQVVPNVVGALDIELLKDEAGGLMMESGITTISFYKGGFPAAAQALRAQFDLVVTSNPWLAGRLIKTKTKSGVCLRHPAKPGAAEIDPLFAATSAEDAAAFKLAPAAPYIKICADMYASKAKVVVGSGSSITGQNEPVARLTLSESAPGEFALIFSMSHVIGDGRTYYEVLQMLQPGATVRELSSARVMSFTEAMRDTCGRKELEWADSGTVMCMSICAMLPCCHAAPKCFAFHLDAEKLAAVRAISPENPALLMLCLAKPMQHFTHLLSWARIILV